MSDVVKSEFQIMDNADNTQIQEVETAVKQAFILEKFLSKIKIVNSGCWQWIAALTKAGYGQIYIHPKAIYTHRFIFEYYYGNICPDLTIDHLCKNTKCCNPAHLEQVSLKENILRSDSPAAVNKNKTHCMHGHKFTPENTYVYPNNNRRKCLICRRISDRNWRLNHPDKVNNNNIKSWLKRKSKRSMFV